VVLRLKRARLLLWLLPCAVYSHVMPAQKGTVNLLENEVYAVVSVPVSALTGADDDGDGLISLTELQKHQTALQTQVDQGFRLSDGGTLGQTVMVSLVHSPTHDNAAVADQLIALKQVKFLKPPAALQLETDLFGKTAAEQQMTIKATRKGLGEEEADVAVLTPARSTYRFFRSTLSTVGSYIQIGMAHVLMGTDHLLFLLTVIVAGVGWRYGLSVITVFTVAHSVTLVLALVGYVQVPSRLVEPLIAASIVFMALVNLRLVPAWATLHKWNLGVVGACGLLHGLGFAASMSEMGLDSTHKLGSLLGFNLGIELGQGIFLLIALAVMALSSRLWPALTAQHRTQGISGFALVMGCIWLVQRLL
jgi:hydrogenase/urease accessory protein HupE